MNPLLRRYIPHLIGGGAIFTAAVVYRQEEKERKIMRPIGYPAWIKHLSPEIFQVQSHWGPWALSDLRTQRHVLLSFDECEEKLKRECSSTTVHRKGNMVVKWDVATVASNVKNEDKYAIDLASKPDLVKLHDGSFWNAWGSVRNALWDNEGKEKDKVVKGGQGKEGGTEDLMMFSVFDGHGGNPVVAELLEKILHPSIACALGGTIGKDVLAVAKGLNLQDTNVCQVIQDAVQNLDDELMRVPMTLFDSTSQACLSHSKFPNPSLVHAHLATLERGGACLSNATIDIAQDKLYVTNVGDCRAVAGWRNPKTQLWRCDVISEIGDCNGDNEEEAERVRKQHPESERDDVIVDSGDTARVLGDSQITRAIGDPFTKRPEVEMQR